MTTYAQKLKDPRWQMKRLQIMKRDKFTCQLCGDKETTLNVHHKKYTYGKDPWDYENSMLITLCEHCHKEVEYIKRREVKHDFDEISICKIDGWEDGARIMWVSLNVLRYFKIYDRNNNDLIGYDIGFHKTNLIVDFLLEARKKTSKFFKENSNTGNLL